MTDSREHMEDYRSKKHYDVRDQRKHLKFKLHQRARLDGCNDHICSFKIRNNVTLIKKNDLNTI